MFIRKYLEEFETGQVRQTHGRTITETDIVMHAGQTGDFFHITWMRNGAGPSHLAGVLPMARLFSASPSD